MKYRHATTADAALLATMNQRLIRDEGHRNPMSVAQLQLRMANWLAERYRAVLFEDAAGPAGYALYRLDEDAVYIRQFFVEPDRRRRGVGRAAFGWLLEHEWHDAARLRLDVLVGNLGAIGFWRSVGFADYCLTMERANNT